MISNLSSRHFGDTSKTDAERCWSPLIDSS